MASQKAAFKFNIDAQDDTHSMMCKLGGLKKAVTYIITLNSNEN